MLGNDLCKECKHFTQDGVVRKNEGFDGRKSSDILHDVREPLQDFDSFGPFHSFVGFQGMQTFAKVGQAFVPLGIGHSLCRETGKKIGSGQ